MLKNKHFSRLLCLEIKRLYLKNCTFVHKPVKLVQYRNHDA